MSIRVYSGPHADRRPGPTPWMARVVWILVGITILGQIAWILVPDTGRLILTWLTVLSFFAASVWHAAIYRGALWTIGYVAISVSIGFIAEALGVATSFPFGTYEYTDALGPAIFSVPVLIPLAWAMMAYPVLLVARALAASWLWVAVSGAVLLAGWDLFLDPQMVGQRYWVWQPSSFAIPGSGIPAQNTLGWFLVAFILIACLDRLPRESAPDAAPLTLLVWTWLASVLANLVFFHRPLVAILGGIMMGIILVPWGWKLWSTPEG